MNNSVFSRAFIAWLPLGLGLTAVFGALYAVVQQNYRQSANDPQISIAEDSALALENGAVPASLAPREIIDAGKSLSPFIIIFDDKGVPLESSVKIGDQLPVPPAGVFDYVRQHGENRLTWQPTSDVRIAAVVTSWIAATASGTPASGFVLAGRSLKEVEDRELRLEMMVGLAWAVTMAITLCAHLLQSRTTKRTIIY